MKSTNQFPCTVSNEHELKQVHLMKGTNQFPWTVSNEHEWSKST